MLGSLDESAAAFRRAFEHNTVEMVRAAMDVLNRAEVSDGDTGKAGFLASGLEQLMEMLEESS